jgi:hypothetical protein
MAVERGTLTPLGLAAHAISRVDEQPGRSEQGVLNLLAEGEKFRLESIIELNFPRHYIVSKL